MVYRYYLLQSTLESGQEARIMLIDFSAAFDRVNHRGRCVKLPGVVMLLYTCLV